MSYELVKSVSLWIAYNNDKTKELFIEAGIIGHAHRSARKAFGPGVSFSVREANESEKSIAYLMEKIDGDDPENWG